MINKKNKRKISSFIKKYGADKLLNSFDNNFEKSLYYGNSPISESLLISGWVMAVLMSPFFLFISELAFFIALGSMSTLLGAMQVFHTFYNSYNHKIKQLNKITKIYGKNKVKDFIFAETNNLNNKLTKENNLKKCEKFNNLNKNTLDIINENNVIKYYSYEGKAINNSSLKNAKIQENKMSNCTVEEKTL